MAQQDLEVGVRVRVAEVRDGAEMPEDLVGKHGVVRWITPGYAGERGYVEVELDDGRVFQFQNKELEAAEA